MFCLGLRGLIGSEARGKPCDTPTDRMVTLGAFCVSDKTGQSRVYLAGLCNVKGTASAALLLCHAA